MTGTENFKLTPKLARYLTATKDDQGYKYVIDQHGVEYVVLMVVDCGRIMFLAQAGTDGTVRRTISSSDYSKFEVVWESLDDKATEVAEQLASKEYAHAGSR